MKITEGQITSETLHVFTNSFQTLIVQKRISSVNWVAGKPSMHLCNGFVVVYWEGLINFDYCTNIMALWQSLRFMTLGK